jgi:uncharacterized protein
VKTSGRFWNSRCEGRIVRFAIINEETPYTGKELASGWVARQTGLDGDCAAGFVGPCYVANEDLVDLDDARAGMFIRSASMAHVIVEHPHCGLGTAVLRQRLLVALLTEWLRENGHDVRRDGDDVYYADRKLTVSIAAPASRSALIHLGINIDPDGAPVAAVGLRSLGIEPRRLLTEILERYAFELETCRHAETKVRTVP